MKTPCIILWNRVFERYELYNHDGTTYCNSEGWETLKQYIADNPHCYTEVPINSKIGRQILAKIGAQRL